MKLFLHVGAPKTGTSAIQNSLYQNFNELEKNKILNFNGIREIEGPRSLISLFNKPPIPIQAKYESYENMKILSKKSWDLFFNICKEKKYSYIIHSSENMAEVLLNKEFIKMINSGGFDEIKFLAYTREPVSYFFSTLNQRIRGGVVPSNIFNDTKWHFYDPIKKIVEFKRNHKELIEIRDFSNLESDLITDFSNIISNFFGIDINLPPPKYFNDSLSWKSLSILNFFNILLKDQEVNKHSNNLRTALIKKLEEIDIKFNFKNNKPKNPKLMKEYVFKTTYDTLNSLKSLSEINYMNNINFENIEYDRDDLSQELTKLLNVEINEDLLNEICKIFDS